MCIFLNYLNIGSLSELNNRRTLRFLQMSSSVYSVIAIAYPVTHTS